MFRQMQRAWGRRSGTADGVRAVLGVIGRGVGRKLQGGGPSIPVSWTRPDPGSALAAFVQGGALRAKTTPLTAVIERRALQTNDLGPQPLWSGYAGLDLFGQTRQPDHVRTRPAMGVFYADLVAARKPDVVVEFGSAFGVSGMYFAAGLTRAGRAIF